jgi:hypothetical protein
MHGRPPAPPAVRAQTKSSKSSRPRMALCWMEELNGEGVTKSCARLSLFYKGNDFTLEATETPA